MEWLNYHHLRYFYVVAQEGGLRPAAEALSVSQPSISAQIGLLEDALGEKLFRRSGRGLVLTETGQTVFRYAQEIFSTGRALLDAVRTGSQHRAEPFDVGVTDAISKLAAREILRPVFRQPQQFKIVCREGKLDELLGQLASHWLDIVLADEPAPSSLKFKTFSHPLGSCGVVVCARPALARKLQKNFPKSLDGAPALLPTENTPLRLAIERWFERVGVRPHSVAEFDDGALMRVFASEVDCFFMIHAVAVEETVRRNSFGVIGEAEGCRTEFYAITTDRRIRHAGVALVTENAQQQLFAPQEGTRIAKRGIIAKA